MTETQANREIGVALLSRGDAARMLGIAPLTLSRWVSRRKIGAYRIAGRLCFASKHLRDYLERVEVGAGRR